MASSSLTCIINMHHQHASSTVSTSNIHRCCCIIELSKSILNNASIMQQQTITCNNIQQNATTYNSIQQNRTNNNQPLRVMKLWWLAYCIISLHSQVDRQPTSATNDKWKQQSRTINHLVAINMITYHQCCILANATLAGQNVIWHNLCWFTYNNQPLSGTNTSNVYC